MQLAHHMTEWLTFIIVSLCHWFRSIIILVKAETDNKCIFWIIIQSHSYLLHLLIDYYWLMRHTIRAHVVRNDIMSIEWSIVWFNIRHYDDGLIDWLIDHSFHHWHDSWWAHSDQSFTTCCQHWWWAGTPSTNIVMKMTVEGYSYRSHNTIIIISMINNSNHNDVLARLVIVLL